MRVIVNADDFGFSDDTVDATIAAMRGGYVTSATLMSAMPASERAVEFARVNPQHSYGVHLTFVGDGAERPVSTAEEVPDLVDRRGRFRQTNSVRLEAALGRLSVAQIEREIAAQILWFTSRGLELSHVDSHRHLHKYGTFREALDRALPPLGISRVRNVQDIYLRRPLMSPTAWLGRAWRADLMRRFTTTDHFYMPASTGDTEWTDLLTRISCGATLEIGVHPGLQEDWRIREAEGAAAFAAAAAVRGVPLVDWRDL